MSTYKNAVFKKLSEMRDGDALNISIMRHPDMFIQCAKQFLDNIEYSWNHFLFANDYSELRKVSDYRLFETEENDV